MEDIFKGTINIAIGILFGFIATTVMRYTFYIFLNVLFFVLEKL